LSVWLIGIVGGMIERVSFASALPERVPPISDFGGADTFGGWCYDDKGVDIYAEVVNSADYGLDAGCGLGDWTAFAYSVAARVLVVPASQG